MNLHIVGKFKDTLKWKSFSGSEKTEVRDWEFNQIQDSALLIITGSIIGIETASSGLFSSFGPLNYMAVGSGSQSWDSDPYNVSKPVNQTSLQNETERLLITADQFEFLDGTGAVLNPQELSARIKLTRILGSNEANGDLREFGLFGGGATSALNSGVMFNWITHPLIQKDSTLAIERIVDVQFSINRS